MSEAASRHFSGLGAHSMPGRIVEATAAMLGVNSYVSIASAHVDGCLYHGDSGTLFAERLADSGAKVAVPTTLNVGALDLIHAGRARLNDHERRMAKRLMDAYVALGCRPTWTCTPYQAGHRPSFGQHIAWGESNAVAFANSVLGARTNRYGDFLDICAAITGRAPAYGLHIDENRAATILVELKGFSHEAFADDAFYAALGAWLGRSVGNEVAALSELAACSEDQLKALGAAAAATGSVGLFHVVGQTPEAPDIATAFHGRAPARVIALTPGELDRERVRLSTIDTQAGDRINAVAVGSPHLSAAELEKLAQTLEGRRCTVPLYACTGRHALNALDPAMRTALAAQNVVLVADTCIVATPILPAGGGVLMTNSGKFAHYAPANTGYQVVFARLEACVEAAVTGRVGAPGAGWS